MESGHDYRVTGLGRCVPGLNVRRAGEIRRVLAADGVGRNTIRGGYAAEINARYSRLFPVTERKSVEFLVESTNLGNRLNVYGLNSSATVDAAGNITTPATLAPNASRDQRLLQLGLRFNW